MILVFFGIIMVFSSSWPEAMQKFGDGYHFLKRQLVFSVIGFMAIIILMNIDYRIYRKFALPIFIFAVILGLLIFTPLGDESKGARRWLILFGFRFMPSDIIKLASIIFLSAFLSNKKERTGTLLLGTIPALIIIGFSCGLIYLQRFRNNSDPRSYPGCHIFIAGMRISHLLHLEQCCRPIILCSDI